MLGLTAPPGEMQGLSTAFWPQRNRMGHGLCKWHFSCHLRGDACSPPSVAPAVVSPSFWTSLSPPSPSASHLTHPAGPGSAPPPPVPAQILPSDELPWDGLNQVTAPTPPAQHDPEGSGWQHRPGRERQVLCTPCSLCSTGKDEVQWLLELPL